MTRQGFLRFFLHAFFGVVSFTTLISCSPEESLPPPLQPTGEVALRGKEIVEGFGSCGFCHSQSGTPGQPLAGGRVLQDSLGEVQAPNITLAKSGINGWSESDIQRLLRTETTPQEKDIDTFFHGGYEWLSDVDISGIIAYLRKLPPVERQIPEREISFLTRNTSGVMRGKREVKGYVPQISSSFKVPYGQYVADNVARCSACHNTPSGIIAAEEYLGGGREITFSGATKVAPNITPSKISGIGEWSEEDIVAYLTTGTLKSGGRVDSRFCPVKFYELAPIKDINAVAAYLRSVPAVD